MKVYPFNKNDRRKNCCEQIKVYCDNLGGNYPKINDYFIKYWKECSLFNFTNTSNEIIINRTNNICETFHSKINRQNLHKDGENFYHLIISILENVVDSDYNIIESIKPIFVKNNIMKYNDNEPILEVIEEDEEDNEDNNDSDIKNKNINNKNNDKFDLVIFKI